MNWLVLATEAISRLPLEKLIVRPPDPAERLVGLKHILEAQERRAPPPPPAPRPEAEILTLPVRSSPPASSGVSLPETVAYQRREIGKLLLRMERHYAQRLRINGVPCDCGAQKHLLDLESLCEETVPMSEDPQVFYQIIEWIREVGPQSSEEAAKSGLYDAEYSAFSGQARDFRKAIIGSLDTKALFPPKPEAAPVSTSAAEPGPVSEATAEEAPHEQGSRVRS